MDFIKYYTEKTAKSAELFKQSTTLMPGGVSHNIRYYAPHPVFMNRGEGSKIFDVDGNEYIDLWMGHYAHILGHNPNIIKKINHKNIEDATHLGTVNPFEIDLAKKITKNIPSIESLKFCTSGTEAAMYALRLARGYTQKPIVIKMAGGWHGAGSELSKAIKYPYVNGVTGVFKNISDGTDYIFFNDIENSYKVLKQYKDSIACIILEPVIGEGGFLPAEKNFLEFLREETHKMNSLLIFDEVITGFRLSLGGAQGVYGITPDLTTMGKIIGGGFNIGLVGGKREIMELSSPKYKGEDKVLIGGGTFSATPYTMRAGTEIINFLENNPDIYTELREKGDYVRGSIRKFIKDNSIKAIVTGTESLYMVSFPFDSDTQINSPSDIGGKTDIYKREHEFKVRLLNNGIHVMHGGGAISFAHTKDDLDLIIAKTSKVLMEMN